MSDQDEHVTPNDLAGLLVDTIRALSATRDELQIWREMTVLALTLLREREAGLTALRRRNRALVEELRAMRRAA